MQYGFCHAPPTLLLTYTANDTIVLMSDDQFSDRSNSPQSQDQQPVLVSGDEEAPLQALAEAGERTTPFMHEIDGESSEIELLEPVTWTASEYIAHQKSPAWFVIFGVGVVVLAVAIYFITGGDLVSAVSVLLFSVIFGIYAGRPPREQRYVLDQSGIHIGEKTYSFSNLRSFAILDEGVFSSIEFMPLRRFMPMISIYFDPKDEDKIIAFLSEYLPIEYRRRDIIDRLMRKIKF